MWTGNWWWRTQTQLPSGVTIIPIILSSNKTLLTQHSGDWYGYPLYISIENLPKAVRKCPSQQGTILLAYLPTDKFEGMGLSKEAAKLAHHGLYHQSLSHILKDIVLPGREGITMTTADGVVRLCFPILGACMCNYPPEQCLLTCTQYL
ncbi:hypothetical protein DACRYDRAFT_50206 [Dacryopinax primogenitus]|uniref:Uncharacterized protein n=1 Tax=Dacryopinax primogenitus (strain DJM 731) TaxID=1858805 RepID=M5GAW0_DACPD|nr:uncharacterized protein DACRYDRAFT_50206 [Dacryopinax primogenitus]EJU03117.1 hypothetical protein DACRYDRAFT_50206 [Dacryopinax primogenitus]